MFPSGGNSRGTAAFTMVELALCIGIIAFAMVAIMGVLPIGMNVQKQNREDTIIDQEGPQWINILRNGQVGWGDLTNSLDYVLVEHTPISRSAGGGGGGREVYGFRGPFFPSSEAVLPPNVVLESAEQLVSLLSIPKFEADSGVVYSNRITAVVRAMAGAQNSQVRLTAANPRPSDQQTEDAFRYQMEVEIVPVSSTPSLNMTREDPAFTNLYTAENVQIGGWLNAYRLDPENVLRVFSGRGNNRTDRDPLSATLYDLRLTLRWPVYKVGDDYRVGPGSRTFRTQLVGRPVFDLYQMNRPNSVYWKGTSIRPRRFDSSVISRDLTL